MQRYDSLSRSNAGLWFVHTLLTYRGHEAEVRGRVECEAGDGVTAEERGPAAQHLAPQQGPPPVILGLGAGAQPAWLSVVLVQVGQSLHSQVNNPGKSFIGSSQMKRKVSLVMEIVRTEDQNQLL